MKIIRRDPARGYLDDSLWVPKVAVNVEGLKAALTHKQIDSETGELFDLKLYRESDHHLVVPRAFFPNIDELPYEVIDVRPRESPDINIASSIRLDAKVPHLTIQRDSVSALMSAMGGILQLRCGAGKTVTALEFIARMGGAAIVVVDNEDLLLQWRKEILLHLKVGEDQIGRIQGTKNDWQKSIVLSTYQTLSKRADILPEAARRWFRVAVFDEGHHLSAPVYSKCISLFPCYRLSLTATPTRADGRHVIAEAHVGPVLYKYLQHELKPKVTFWWTGVELDMSDRDVAAAVEDRKKNLHLSKLWKYLGGHRKRLELITSIVRQKMAQGRKILVLCYSVNEVVNLFMMMNHDPNLFSEIPRAKPEDVGADKDLTPAPLGDDKVVQFKWRLGQLRREVGDPLLHPMKKQEMAEKIRAIEERLHQHEVWEKIEDLYAKQQREFVRGAVTKYRGGIAGLMTQKVKADVRRKMLGECQVMFAISKFGREGLDDSALDTVILCEPTTDDGGIAQRMGRIQRTHSGKQEPEFIILEDSIEPSVAMCQKMRKALRNWPADEGGPYQFELKNRPNQVEKKERQWKIIGAGAGRSSPRVP